MNCFAMSVEESVAKKGSIGRPLMMTDAQLRRRGEAPTWRTARWASSACAGRTSRRDTGTTSRHRGAALDDDGFFHTGDLARRDEDGFFTIAGRRKDMLISGGVNVYPAEIEAELLLHPAVQDAAVVGVPERDVGRDRRRVRRAARGGQRDRRGTGRVPLHETREVQGPEAVAVPRCPPPHGLRQSRQSGPAGAVRARAVVSMPPPSPRSGSPGPPTASARQAVPDVPRVSSCTAPRS